MNASFNGTRKFLTAGAVACAAVASVMTLVHRAQPAAAATLPSMSGETLVRGIYFHQGLAASLLPARRYSPARASSPASAQMAALEDRIVGHLQAEDPAFFEHFARTLYSGDLVRIDETLEATAKRIEALSNETGYVPGKVAEKPTWIWLGVGYWIAYTPDEFVPATKTALQRTMLAEAIVRQLAPAKI
jgi:hypothetical protein